MKSHYLWILTALATLSWTLESSAEAGADIYNSGLPDWYIVTDYMPPREAEYNREMWLGHTLQGAGMREELTEIGSGDYPAGVEILRGWLENGEERVLPLMAEKLELARNKEEYMPIFLILKMYKIGSPEISDIVFMRLKEEQEKTREEWDHWFTREAIGYLCQNDSNRHRKMLRKLKRMGSQVADFNLEKLKDPNWEPDSFWKRKYDPGVHTGWAWDGVFPYKVIPLSAGLLATGILGVLWRSKRRKKLSRDKLIS